MFDTQRVDGINLKYNAPVTLTFALLSLLALALAELTDGESQLLRRVVQESGRGNGEAE